MSSWKVGFKYDILIQIHPLWWRVFWRNAKCSGRSKRFHRSRNWCRRPAYL